MNDFKKNQKSLESVVELMGSEYLPLARCLPLRETSGCRWELSSDIYKAVMRQKGEAYSLCIQRVDLIPNAYRKKEIQDLKNLSIWQISAFSGEMPIT